jgi:hypothetical protein
LFFGKLLIILLNCVFLKSINQQEINMAPKTKRGGAREGAGRKPLADKTIMKSVKLTPELWEQAKRIGDGNASEGIRRALKR